MLRSHGRYAYLNMTKRSGYRWPGGKRMAVYGTVNVEQFNRYGDHMWLTWPRGNCTHTENLPVGIVPGS